jgi:hypothetical protein
MLLALVMLLALASQAGCDNGSGGPAPTAALTISST